MTPPGDVKDVSETRRPHVALLAAKTRSNYARLHGGRRVYEVSERLQSLIEKLDPQIHSHPQIDDREHPVYTQPGDLWIAEFYLAG